MNYYGDLFADTHIPGGPVPSRQFNNIARVLDTQLQGALAAHGNGVIGANSWTVTAGEGLSVDVTAGHGVISSALHGYIYARTYASRSISLPANTSLYLYATAVFRSAPGEPDTREDGSVEFVATGSTAPADSLRLAKVVTGGESVVSVQDLREFLGTEELQQEVADCVEDLDQLREAVGTRYFGAEPPAASLDARISDLEEAPTGAVFWRPLHKEAGDETTIEQEVASRLYEHVEKYHQEQSAFVAEEPWDIDAVNQARAVLKVVRTVDPEHAAWQLNTVCVVWGVWGEGTEDSPDYIDRENSTWLPE